MRDDARLSANTAAEYGGGVYATGASTGEGASVECVGRASIAANSASYAHLAGRTGRKGREGTAVTILDHRHAPRLVAFADALGVPFSPLEGD